MSFSILFKDYSQNSVYINKISRNHIAQYFLNNIWPRPFHLIAFIILSIREINKTIIFKLTRFKKRCSLTLDIRAVMLEKMRGLRSTMAHLPCGEPGKQAGDDLIFQA
jgi:hypothetical protein